MSTLEKLLTLLEFAKCTEWNSASRSMQGVPWGKKKGVEMVLKVARGKGEVDTQKGESRGTSVKRMKHGFHGTGWVLSLFLPHCAPMPRWLHPSSIITGLPVLQMENGEVQTEWPEGNFVGALVVTFFKGFGPCGLLNDNWLLTQTISTRSPPPNMQDSTACQRWAELGRALPHTDYSMRMAPHSYVATWRNHKLPLHRL